MLTFDRVINVFEEYLRKDDICEVITTKRGYTVMYWDERQLDWYSVIHCHTPETMISTFLRGYSDLLEQGYTLNRRELSEEERTRINLQLDVLRKKCGL